jgi:ABC-type oligopeptide transport system ATPase subunit
MSALLTVSGLTKTFALKAGLFASSQERVSALSNVSLTLERGQTYGLVGESGSGKTTLARVVVQLEKQDSGTMTYQGEDSPWVVGGGSGLDAYRREVRYVFQDPSSSLDPRLSVGTLLTLGARYHLSKSERPRLVERAKAALEAVGLRAADWDRRPSEFSGGQRQRIALARALVTRPRLLLCDEVVSALDVSVRGQILELLLDLKRQFGLSLLFIAHDLDVVAYMSDRVGVLYRGVMMEEAPATQITTPLHPYTKLLYESSAGLPPAAATTGSVTRGCPFQDRCPLVHDRCRNEVPELKPVAPGRLAACHALAKS